MDDFKQTERWRREISLPFGALAVCVALAVSTPGCGGSGTVGAAVSHPSAPGNAQAVAIVTRAARATLSAPAGVELHLEGASALGPSPAPAHGSGEFDFPAATGSETIDLGEVGRQEHGNEQVVLLASRAYLQPKGVGSSVLPAGKEWVSAPLSGSESVSTNFPSFVLQVEGVNPQFLLTELVNGAISATPAGATTIEGERARRYDVVIDLARALNASSGPTAAAFGQAIQSELASAGGSRSARAGTTSIVAWVGKGRVLQLRSSPPGAGVGTATMTLCCFGVPVETGTPAAARTVDIASLTPSGERENNGGGDSDGG